MPVIYTSSTPSVCSISGSIVNYLATGTCTLLIDQAGNGSYQAAPQVSVSFPIIKADQVISFNLPGSAFIGGTSILSASSDSGSGVSFSNATSGVCSISGSTLTYIAAGNCVIRADKAANVNYNAAPQVSSTVVVSKVPQLIAFNAPATGNVGIAPVNLLATASSGLTVSFSLDPASLGCALSGINNATVTYNTAGNCVILADQVGDALYSAAPQVSQTILLSVAIDITPPVMMPPADIVVGSTGPLTAVALGAAAANDDVDGPLGASVDNSGPYAPGVYTLTWSATDTAGNTGTATQQLTVQPQVTMGLDQVTSEGATLSIPVSLNGTFPNNVTVNYAVSGTATNPADHNLANGNLVILAGSLQGVLIANIVTDGAPEADETLIVTLNASPVNAVLGGDVSNTTTIREGNLSPNVSLNAVQAGMHIVNAIQLNGVVRVTATVNDPNVSDAHSYDWSSTDAVLTDIDGDTTDATFVFDPSIVTAGVYTVRAVVTDNGAPAISVQANFQLRVSAVETTLSLFTDTDGDFIPDAVEGSADDDGDGIPNYLDNTASGFLMPTTPGVNNSAVLETIPGLTLQLGTTAFAANNNGGLIDQTTIDNNWTGGGNAVDSITNIGGIFDFQIGNLPRPGLTVPVVLPQENPVPVNAVYRKLMPGIGWSAFVEDGNNFLMSAPGAQGVCPSVFDSGYTPGLTQGHWCVLLFIEDGGPNDADGLLNGSISDPGGVGSGGGSGSTPTFVFLSAFDAFVNNANEVLLHWATDLEVDHYGFELIREDKATGVAAMIDAKIGSNANGAEYQFADTTAIAGNDYAYTLIDIDVKGKRTEHGPLTVSVVSGQSFTFDPETNVTAVAVSHVITPATGNGGGALSFLGLLALLVFMPVMGHRQR